MKIGDNCDRNVVFLGVLVLLFRQRSLPRDSWIRPTRILGGSTPDRTTLP